jgi:hypothetical protein
MRPVSGESGWYRHHHHRDGGVADAVLADRPEQESSGGALVASTDHEVIRVATGRQQDWARRALDHTSRNHRLCVDSPERGRDRFILRVFSVSAKPFDRIRPGDVVVGAGEGPGCDNLHRTASPSSFPQRKNQRCLAGRCAVDADDDCRWVSHGESPWVSRRRIGCALEHRLCRSSRGFLRASGRRQGLGS